LPVRASGSARKVAVDADGQSDTTGFAGKFRVRLSGDGRYAFFFATGTSNLAPQEVAGAPSHYLLRKNLGTGEIELASRGMDGRTPQQADPLTRRLGEAMEHSFDVNRDGSVVVFLTESFPPAVLVHDMARLSSWTAPTADLGDNVYSPQVSDSGAVVSLLVSLDGDDHAHLYRFTQSGRTLVDTCPGGTPCVDEHDLSGDGNRLLADQTGFVGGSNDVMVYTVGGAPIDMTPSFGHVRGARLSGVGTLVLANTFANIGGHHNGLALSPVGSHITEADYIESTNSQFRPWDLSRDGRIAGYGDSVDPTDVFANSLAGTLWNRTVGAGVHLPGATAQHGEKLVDLSDNGLVVAWTRCSPELLNSSCSAIPGAWVQRYG
jgi:hypothetical protein